MLYVYLCVCAELGGPLRSSQLISAMNCNRTFCLKKKKKDHFTTIIINSNNWLVSRVYKKTKNFGRNLLIFIENDNG